MRGLPRWLLAPPRRRAVAGITLGLIVTVAGGYFVLRPSPFEEHLSAAEQAEAVFDFEGAARELAACAELRPDDPGTRLRVARVARRAGDYESARKELDRYAELVGSSDRDVALERALLRCQTGGVAEVADELVRKVETGHPQSAEIEEALIQGFVRVYRTNNAMFWAERLAKERPGHVVALIARGMMFEITGQADEAIRAYQTALTHYPDHFQVRLQLGEALLRVTRTGEAAEHFERLYARAPDHPDVALGRARCQQAGGRAADAEATLDRALAARPADARLLAARGRAALDAGDPKSAEPFLRSAIAGLPVDREVHLNLAQCLAQLGRNEEAERYQKRFQEIDADVKKLAEVSETAMKKPNDPTPRHEAGLICLRNGQVGQAMRWFAGALQLDPRYRPTHTTLAEHYEKTGRPELAAQHREKAGRP